MPRADRLLILDDEWGEDPVYLRSDWKEEVLCNDTQRGYWDWVGAKKDEKESDEYYAQLKGN